MTHAGTSTTVSALDDARPREPHLSATAARAAPPVPRNVDKNIGCIAVFGVVGIAWHIVWIVAAVFLALAIRDAAWNANVWPKLYAVWEKSYMCERCGFIGPVDQEDGNA
jgi:hypothetical protein